MGITWAAMKEPSERSAASEGHRYGGGVVMMIARLRGSLVSAYEARMQNQTSYRI